MTKLQEINREQAEKLLQETDFNNRLVGIAMNASAGNTYTSLYSLEEVARFIYADSSEVLFQRGKPTIAHLDMEELVKWIRAVYEDDELANVLEKELKEAPNKIAQLTVASKRIHERLKQCYKLVDERR